MPVFISHRTADDRLARQVASRLQSTHQIECYVDDLDTRLGRVRHTQEVTRLIVERLKACTNLLAIVTQNTKGSWWVPFEIGVARQAPRVITSYTNLTDSVLPEFLQEWPILRGDGALDVFARLYKGRQRILKERVMGGRGPAADRLSTANDFHSELKRSLSQ